MQHCFYKVYLQFGSHEIDSATNVKNHKILKMYRLNESSLQRNESIFNATIRVQIETTD